MNKTIKKLLLAFTLLCIVLLIVFSAELFLLNRSTEPTVIRQTPPPSESPPSETEDVPNNGENGPNEDTPPSIQPPAEPPGTRHELMIADDVRLLLYADEELFEYSDDMELLWEFSHIGSETQLQIGLALLLEGAETFAETMLLGYLDGGESTVEGVRPIGQSMLSGVYVSGEIGAETYSAWVCSIPSDVVEHFGVYFVFNHSNEEHRDAVFTILDTLQMVILRVDVDDETDEDIGGES